MFKTSKNLGLKFIALGLAIFFWFFVLTSENTFFVFPEEIPVEAFNVPEGLAAVNELGTVTLTVKADGEVYKTLTADQFRAYVDLQGLAAGTQTVKISVNTETSEVSIVSIDPESLSVVLEALVESEFLLSTSMEGDPATHYEASLLIDEQQTIQVRGAKSVVQQVESVVAKISLNGEETESFTKEVTLEAVDGSGNIVSNVTLTPAEVWVDVTLEQVESQKAVGVKVNVESISGGWVESMSAVPAIVYIQGEEEILADISTLETEEIHINKDSEKVELSVTLILPEGVTLVEGEPDEVEVTLIISYSDEEEPSSP